MTPDTRYMLIGRGKNGWHAGGLEHGNQFSSSGGSLEDYLSHAADGTPIYDCEEADYDSFAKFVFAGPMIKYALAAGSIDSFNSRNEMVAMLPALQGEFKAIAKLNLAGISSLDFVAVDVYLALLKEKVPGAKIGTVQQGKIVWS